MIKVGKLVLTLGADFVHDSGTLVFVSLKPESDLGLLRF